MKYLNIGKGTVIPEDTVIGIFDLDITSQSHLTRKYLTASEKRGEVINASEDIPKTFIVGCDGDARKVWLCQVAPATLVKRAESGTL